MAIFLSNILPNSPSLSLGANSISPPYGHLARPVLRFHPLYIIVTLLYLLSLSDDVDRFSLCTIFRSLTVLIDKRSVRTH